VFCPHCRSKNTAVEKTATDAEVMRWHACSCGARWRSLARVVKGSLSVVAKSHGQGPGNPPATRRQPTNGLHAAPATKESPNEINNLPAGLCDSSVRGEGKGGAPGFLFPISVSDPDPSQPSGSGLPERSSKSSPARAAASYPAEFEALWEAIGTGGKFPALKAWQKARKLGATTPQLLEAWGKYIASDRPSRGFVKHLSTWLNERGWETPWKPAAAPKTRDEKNTEVLLEWVAQQEAKGAC